MAEPSVSRSAARTRGVAQVTRWIAFSGKHTIVSAFLALGTMLAACGAPGSGPPALPGDDEVDGGPPDDGGSPRVLEAVSVDSTTVVVTFSHAMGEGAERVESYRVALAAAPELESQVARQSLLEAPAVLVREVFLNDQRTEATLRTDWQADMDYLLIVSNVRDQEGVEIDPGGGRMTFSGTEPDLDDPQLVDSNGDGLPDRVQEEGWTIFVDETGDGQFTTRHVTSDPNAVDTNGDGVSDLEKFRYRLDPRRADTDGDGLTDFDELYLYGSHPRTVDTAGDAMQGGVVDNRFFDGAKVERGLSPILVDSSGDGISDYVNFIERGRDARFAHIPVSTIEVVDDLRLTVNYDYTVTEEETVIEQSTTSASHTIDQTTETTQSRTDSETHTSSVEVGLELKASWNPIASGVSKSVTVGFSNSSTTSTTRAAREATRQAVTEAQETTRAQHSGRSVTFSAIGGEIASSFVVRNEGEVAFRLSNLQLSVRWFDPMSRSLRAIGTLEVPIETVTLAPGDATGPLIADLNVSATLMEQIMKHPSALVVEPVHFDLENEEGRSFAFIHQQVQERSSLLTVDYGIDGPVEKYLLATNLYRHYPDNTHAGMPLAEILTSLGIAFETVTEGGRTIPVSIGGVAEDEATSSFWLAIVSDQAIAPDGTDFEDYRLKPGQSITLAYIQDKDDDGLSSFEEFLYGTSDHATHTPGLPTDAEAPGFPHEAFDDSFKAKVGWEVRAEGRDPYLVLPDPTTLDSNGDGCSDYQNWVMGTDPFLIDTSGDGVPDCTAEGGRRDDALRRLAGPRIDDLQLHLGPYTRDGRVVSVSARIFEENYPIRDVLIVWDQERQLVTEIDAGGTERFALHEWFTYADPGEKTVLVTARDERGAERTEAVSRRINPELDPSPRASRNAEGSVDDLGWNDRGDRLAWASNERVRVFEFGADLRSRHDLGQPGSGVEAFSWSTSGNFVTFFDRAATDDAQCCVVSYDADSGNLAPPARMVLSGLDSVVSVQVVGLAPLEDRSAVIGEVLYWRPTATGFRVLERQSFFDPRVNTLDTHDLIAGPRLVAVATPPGQQGGDVVARPLQMPLPQSWNAAATLSEDYRLRFHDLEAGGLHAEFTHPDAEGIALAWSGDDRFIAATGVVGNESRLFVYEWNLDTFVPDERYLVIDAAGETRVHAVSWDPTSSLLALGLSDGSLRIYDAGTFNLQASLSGAHSGEVSFVAWNPDGRTVATAGSDNEVRVWSVYDD